MFLIQEMLIVMAVKDFFLSIKKKNLCPVFNKFPGTKNSSGASKDFFFLSQITVKHKQK